MSKSNHAMRSLLRCIGMLGSARSRVVRPVSARLHGAARWRAPTLATVTLTFGVALLAPSAAVAGLTRPFLCQIPSSVFSTGSGPEGIAVGAADHLWVTEQDPTVGKTPELGEQGRSKLYEFDSAYSDCGHLLASFEIEGLDIPHWLSYESLTEHLYAVGGAYSSFPGGNIEVFEVVGGKAELVERWADEFGGASFVAVDNSTELLDPARGSVYVAHQDFVAHQDLPPGVGKFDAKGNPVEFAAKETYISGSQITGTPEEPSFTNLYRPDISVDSKGNIFVVNNGAANSKNEDEPAVDEYAPSGEFVMAFTGRGVPSLGQSDHGFFGGELDGVAVDPVTGDVVISVNGDSAAIDEFSSTGTFLDQITTTSSGTALAGGEDMAMTFDSHGDLYLIERGSSSINKAVDVYGPAQLHPSVTLAEAGARAPTSVSLSGSVNPEGQELDECQFEYVTEAAFDEINAVTKAKEGFTKAKVANCEPSATTISLNGVTRVTRNLTGLAPGTTYYYRLLASSEGPLGGTSETEPLAFTAPATPLVGSTSVSDISSMFAELHAQIAPRGADTSYQFQYIEAARYEAGAEDPYAAGTSVPVAPVGVGSGGPTGGADATVVQQIGGLVPGTLYRFRVVASNAQGTAMGEAGEGGEEVAHVFATLPAVTPGLPDHRAYELVTPPDKGDAADMFSTTLSGSEIGVQEIGYPSESGDQFLLANTIAAFGPFPASHENAYVFSRTSQGWAYTSLDSPSLGVQNIDEEAFDPADLSRVALTDSAGSLQSSTGQSRTIIAGPTGGPYATLRGDKPIHFGSEQLIAEHTEIAGTSRDLDHIVLQSRGHTLAAGAGGQVDGSHALYEWESVGTGDCSSLSSGFSEGSQGCLSLVNVKSGGALLNKCGAIIGQGRETLGGTQNAVSADGARVFFTAPDPGRGGENLTPLSGPGCWDGAEVNPPELYMRFNGSTTEISEPQQGAPEAAAHYPAVYVGASEDGSKVFFISKGELTPNDAGIHDLELYEYETETGKLTRISAGESGDAAGDVYNVPAVSADGSAVYFTAFGALAHGASELTPALEGRPVNLYRYDTSSGTTTYVAEVDQNDFGVGGDSWVSLTLGFAAGPDTDWNVYTTPDGNYLLFGSERELTGYSTVAHAPTDCYDGIRQGRCTEIYRYHYEPESGSGGSLVCVSCDPNGAPPVYDAGFVTGNPGLVPVRAMSDDGSYVFFQTVDPLVPQATNHTLDVYEWEAQGTGGCELVRGCVHLINSGTDASPSFFLGTSSDGSNVFFGTHARLVPEDTDNSGDVYDARICTETDPCIEPAHGETAQCEGGSCQTPPAAPTDATPTSMTFTGPGDAFSEAPLPSTKTVTKKAIAKCKKGFTKKKTRCVKRLKKKQAKSGKRVRGDRRASR
jgi:hypothetical protein